MTVDDVYKIAAPRFRRKRIEQFLEFFKPDSSTTILDVGGCPRYWQNAPHIGRITILNLPAYIPPPEISGYELVYGDGTRLPFADRSFDIVHSNGVMVNLGAWERQAAFSRELRRVGRGLWVQTPARYFPVESQTFDPFFHWFPPRIQRHFLRHFTLWGWIIRPSRAEVESYLANNRLNTFREMNSLFPDCTIRREKLLGFTKSYIAVRPVNR